MTTPLHSSKLNERPGFNEHPPLPPFFKPGKGRSFENLQCPQRRSIRNFQEISNENRKTVKYGTETISNRTPFLWTNLPNEYKLATSLHDFKLKIKNCHWDKYVCRLWQNFQQSLGFL